MNQSFGVLPAVAVRHEGFRITVFAGSELGTDPLYAQAAYDLGCLLAAQRIELIFGGTAGGLMELVAQAAYTAGGRVTGVVPVGFWQSLRSAYCTTLDDQSSDLRARKARMAELAQAFIVLPGGTGTLDELSEVVAFSHLGLSHKPIALCNTAGFFQPYVRLLEHVWQQGLVTTDIRESLIVEPTPALVLTRVFADFRWPLAPFLAERSTHDADETAWRARGGGEEKAGSPRIRDSHHLCPGSTHTPGVHHPPADG